MLHPGTGIARCQVDGYSVVITTYAAITWQRRVRETANVAKAADDLVTIAQSGGSITLFRPDWLPEFMFEAMAGWLMLGPDIALPLQEHEDVLYAISVQARGWPLEGQRRRRRAHDHRRSEFREIVRQEGNTHERGKAARNYRRRRKEELEASYDGGRYS